ncbi:MAG: hybrid sensor histidine kinase/response regulator [Bacteroidales bacterium]|nr:hybrid sensor histidine kinase/response regulator [Bacteroidales bacterium]
MKNVEQYTKGFVDVNPSDFSIFVVDDVMANVLLMKMVLAKDGYNVIQSTDPTKVVEMARETPPDLFILDIMMPKIDGITLAKMIKEDECLRDIPILFLTAFEDKDTMMRGFEAGASDYLTKPFERDILLARVRSQLKLVASRNVIEQQNENLKEIIYGRDKMYSVIAHDLRSPLGSIKMTLKAVEDILREMNIDESLTELMVESGKQVSELFSLLDNLLKWTKAMTGTLKVVYQTFDVSTIVVGLMDMYRSVAAQKGINLVADNAATFSALVYADVDMSSTVLRNLLSNAIKFTEAGKNIYIEAREEDGFVVLGVRDEGCGMTEDEMNRLFNKDTHFTKYGTNREEGSGLGLILCKNFADMMGGKLTLTSQVGVGSTFSLYIPISK